MLLIPEIQTTLWYQIYWERDPWYQLSTDSIFQPKYSNKMALLTPTSHTPSCSLKRSDGLLLYLFKATFANIYNGKFSILLCCLSICFLLQQIYIFPVKSKLQMRTFCSIKTFSLYIFYSGVCARASYFWNLISWEPPLYQTFTLWFVISDPIESALDSKNLDKPFSCRQICRLPCFVTKNTQKKLFLL